MKHADYIEERPSLSEISEQAQRRLRERPTISIRRRLAGGFLFWIIFSVAISVYSMVTISRIDKKLHFLEAAQSYAFEIQQARRFEKNYFLYKTNLGDAVEHAHQAKEILNRNRDGIEKVVSSETYQAISRHLERYENLLFDLEKLKNIKEHTDNKINYVELNLRKYGAGMVTFANQLVSDERQEVNALLRISYRISFIFLIVLLFLIASFAVFIARQMLAPLNRMIQATNRIAEGDFTPIIPKRRYHDEFSELAMAMNHMMLQLDQRQEQLVHAHKLKAIGTLTAGVAHELNNPLNNIILTSSALMEDYKELDEEEIEDMINDMIVESERAQKIVRNLLDFARESELESEALEIEGVIDETLRLVNNPIKLAKIKVKGEVDPDLPPVLGDRQQLIQVFLNIILNALDAMPDGGSLTISVYNTKDREFVAIDFSDTGTGISEQKLIEIFDPFYTAKREGKGTGLGLSVSLGIVKKHGGDIRVSSKVNK